MAEGLLGPILGAVAGPLVGGLMGGDSSAPTQTGSTTQTVTSQPWSGLLPFLLGSPGTAAIPATAATPGTAGMWSPTSTGGTAGQTGLNQFGASAGVPPGYTLTDLQEGRIPASAFQAAGLSSTGQFLPGTAGTPGSPGQAATPATPGLFPSAMNWFTGPGPQFPDISPVAPFNPTQIDAFNAIVNRGMGGSPLVNQASSTLSQMLAGGAGANPAIGYLTPTARGDMLNANPYIDAMFGNAASRVGQQFNNATMPSIASYFGGAGRFGSGAMDQAISTQQNNLTDTMNRLATSIYGGNYANERNLQMGAATNLGGLFNQGQNNMLQAAQLAPGLAATDFMNFGQALGVGNTLQNQQQQTIADQIARFNFGQNQPLMKLQALSGILQGFGGQSSTSTGTTTQQQTTPGSPLGQMLGGAQLANALFPPQVPANAGAPLGFASESLGLSGFGGFQPDMGFQAPRIGMF